MSRTLWAALAASLMSSSAVAQELPVEQARRDLINRAERSRSQGNHAQALELGTRAGQVRMTPSLRLLIAQEHNALGHILDALDQAERCARETESDATLHRHDALLAACLTLRDQLASQVGRLTIQLSQPPAGTRIFVGETELIEALWNVSLPMLPGTARVTARSAGGLRFARSVNVARGESAEVVVRLEPPAEQSPAITAPLRDVTAPRTPRGPSVGPWILAGTSLVGAGLAVVFWTLHGGAISERDSACDAAGCDPGAINADSRARTFTTLTNAAIGVGAGAALGAGLWWLLDRRRAERPALSRRFFVAPLAEGLLVGAEGSL